ncbi:hypothetical protein BJX96DRAFT_141357 [Aspergillus floccosus]
MFYWRTSREKSQPDGNLSYCWEECIVVRAGMMRRLLCYNYKHDSSQQCVIQLFLAIPHAVIVGVFVCLPAVREDTDDLGCGRCMNQTGNL